MLIPGYVVGSARQRWDADALWEEGWLITSLKGQKMSHIHSREYIEGGSTVSVECSHQINVIVMDDSNYSNFKNGRSFKHYGGFYKRFPANITVPHSGNWNVVLALPAGHQANIRYSINVIG